ncbi:MAG: nitrilase-related carbon-nitrogen hydrolase [Candidatus Zixiibacteriota bacterium]
MKVGYLQFKPKFGDTKFNLDKIEELSSGAKMDILVLPELCTTGYLFLESDNLDDFAETLNGPTINRLSSLAEKLDAAIVAGFFEKAGDKYFNSQAFIKPDGKIHVYRKIHLFNREKIFFKPGDRPLEIIEFRGARVGLLICFDWIFPEIYRKYAMLGADIICHSTNLVLPYSQKASFARAVENRMFIALSNRTGKESRSSHEITFTGRSIIYSPRGDILASSEEQNDDIKIVEIDYELARNKWITEKNHLLNDRRPEFYL